MWKEAWFSTKRPQSRGYPPAPTCISRPQSLINNASCSQISPLQEETPRSSTSSLYSRDSLPQVAGISRSTLCSIESKDEGSQLSLQVSSATSLDGDESCPLLKYNERLSVPMNNKLNSPGSRLDAVEVLSREPGKSEDLEAQSTQPDRVDEATSDSVEENMVEPVDEIHEASEVADSTLAKARTTTTRTSFNETPKLPPAPITRQPSHRVANPSHSRIYRFSRTQAPTPSSTSLRRNPFVHQVQRKKSFKKGQMKTQRKPLGAKKATRNNPKWTENVSDLLSGKLFHRIEPDEMLTPAQLEAYKLRRLSRLQLQIATESKTSLGLETETENETPNEPFYMDDLPSRIGSSGVELTASTPLDGEADPRLPVEASMNEVPVTRYSHGDQLFPGRPLSEASAASDNPSLDPQTQMKSPTRHMFRKTPQLPTISEAALRNDEDPPLGRGLNNPSNDAADVDHVFLRSTPFTMTAPAYRHGPIRLAKADLCPDPKLGADDGGLDWTAFQMAILGGAGDYFTDSEHIIRRQEAEDAEAICEWWDDWDFEGHGSLVACDHRSARASSSTASGGVDDGCLYHDIGRDNPYNARHKWRSLRRQAASEGRKLDLDLRKCRRQSEKLYNGGGIKQWSASGHASRLLQRGSLASLPQSPMLDLRVVTSANGDVDYVPMGFNLSHDLGDFLSWEAENVYSDNAVYDGGVI